MGGTCSRGINLNVQISPITDTQAAMLIDTPKYAKGIPTNFNGVFLVDTCFCSNHFIITILL